MELTDELPRYHVLGTAVQQQDTVLEVVPQVQLKGVNWEENKSILTPTKGFLEDGYTHTLNPYVGCSNAGSVCGRYCYAQHFHSVTKGRPWGLYGAKRNIREAYRRDFDRLKHPRNGDPKPLRVYMSSVTDPYLAQEKQWCRTQAALEEMLSRPPDVLVIQTHTVVINRDFELIQQLARKCELWVSVTVETGIERLPGFPPHPSKPAQRIETLTRFREAGIQTQATISPLLPLANPEQFARALNSACNRVIIDHYEFGDGSHGARTRRTNFPQLLEQAGFGEWNNKEKLWEIRAILAGVLGEDRVLVSAEGFNAVGQAQTATHSVSQPETSNLPMVIAPAKPALVVADPKALPKPTEVQPIFRLNAQNPTPEDFNELLRRHQWEISKPLAVLHLVLPSIIKRFYGSLPLPALSWSTSSRGTLGWYVAQDGLALNHRINLNSMHASQPFAVILMTLAHELCHEWQYLYGKPGKYGYHNKEFQRKCLEIGIPCTDRGVSLGMQEPFTSFLRELGIDPADPTPFTQTPDDDDLQPKSKPGSRLKPWACNCTRVWASVRVQVDAICTKCDSPFAPQQPERGG